jgi:serine/threonine protein kinase
MYAEKSAEQKIAELEKKLETVSGKEKVEVLTDLASLLYTRNPGKCIEYCNRAIDLTEQLDYPEEKAWALICKGYALDVKGERKKNIEYGKEALQIFKSLGNKKGIAAALNAIGYFYHQRDFYNIALEYFLKALKTFEELGRNKKKVYVYLCLGNLYFSLEDDQKALTYFQKGLKILEVEGGHSLQGTFLHNIGLVYRNRKDFHNALEYLQKAQKIFEASGDRFWLAATLNNIGDTFAQLGRNQKALTYFHKSQEIREELNIKTGLYYTFQHIGDVYVKMKDRDKALSYYDRAFKIASELNDNSLLERIYKRYSDIYAVKGDYKKAYRYHNLFTKAKDAIMDAKKNKQIAEMQEKYETEKKTRQIDILEKENKIQKITRNALAAIVVLAAMIIILLFKKYLYLFAFWKKQKYIGGYRLTEVIGSGGMGTVYHAHSLSDKSETAAVKILNDQFFKDESSRKRFKQEGTIIESLDHPNIVKIYERGEYKDKLYIAMEYLQGKTLAKKIQEQGRIDLSHCLHIMIQAADALACIHGKSIVHRDLKPENIMLIHRDGDPNMVKLLDFGLARTRFQSRLTRTGMLVGTVNYMSPEQVSGRPSSAASDVYTLGVVFYEMLTGRRTFQGETITDIADKILTDTPGEPKQCRPEIPDEINRLIMKMLSKKPGRRPSAELVLNALTELNGIE